MGSVSTVELFEVRYSYRFCIGRYLFIRSDGTNNEPETFCLRYPRSLFVCAASDLT